jgi:hypothetical protein
MPRRFGLLTIVLALVVSACGNEVSAETLAFCEEYLEVSTLVNSGPEDDPQAWVDETLAGLDSIQADAPSAISSSVETVAAALTEPISNLDEEGFNAATESDDYAEASDAIDAFLESDCEWETMDVEATEYAYTADLGGVEPGVVGFDFSNAGSEFHEMVLVRINDDVEESVEELLALPEEEAEAMTTFVGVSFQAPGDSGTLYADLDPGRYAFFCFLPVGATPENMEALESGEGEEGPPHFTQGMFEEFTIEG